VFGQHTREVLREHGYSDAEIDQMVAQGAIQLPASTRKGATR
jgi:crotonobetainyl-CoA:carnitine CoA-transferase CaiB-like acyl-CoA transferase